VTFQNKLKILRKPLAVAARNLLGTITSFTTEKSIAALTFDDGPHPEFTLRVLGLLEQYQAHATFFMIGDSAKKHPDIVKQVADAGHAIGNHSLNHPSFLSISGSERRKQIRSCERTIAPYGAKLFRPPYGEQSLMSRLDALRLGYRVVTWNLDVGDWWCRDSNRMAELLTHRIRPGSVIVFHDAIFGGKPRNRSSASQQRNVSRESMLTTLQIILGRLQNTYSFVTIPELLRQGRACTENWYTRR